MNGKGEKNEKYKRKNKNFKMYANVLLLGGESMNSKINIKLMFYKVLLILMTFLAISIGAVRADHNDEIFDNSSDTTNGENDENYVQKVNEEEGYKLLTEFPASSDGNTYIGSFKINKGNITQNEPVTYRIEYPNTAKVSLYDGSNYLYQNRQVSGRVLLNLNRTFQQNGQDVTGIQEEILLHRQVTIRYEGAAKSNVGPDKDVVIVLSNMRLFNYEHSNKPKKYLCVFDTARALVYNRLFTYDKENNKYVGLDNDAMENIIHNGVRYTVQIYIDGGNGNFLFGARDIDIKQHGSEYYGDYSEGISFPKLDGINTSTFKIQSDCLLAGKVVDNVVRITGSKTTDTAEEEQRAGFSVIVDNAAKGLTFHWTGGRWCGTRFCDVGTLENLTGELNINFPNDWNLTKDRNKKFTLSFSISQTNTRGISTVKLFAMYGGMDISNNNYNDISLSVENASNSGYNLNRNYTSAEITFNVKRNDNGSMSNKIDGYYYFVVYVKDVLGNEKTASTDILLDTVAPSIDKSDALKEQKVTSQDNADYVHSFPSGVKWIWLTTESDGKPYSSPPLNDIPYLTVRQSMSEVSTVYNSVTQNGWYDVRSSGGAASTFEITKISYGIYYMWSVDSAGNITSEPRRFIVKKAAIRPSPIDVIYNGIEHGIGTGTGYQCVSRYTECYKCRYIYGYFCFGH